MLFENNEEFIIYAQWKFMYYHKDDISEENDNVRTVQRAYDAKEKKYRIELHKKLLEEYLDNYMSEEAVT